jgi:hypothetical protein
MSPGLFVVGHLRSTHAVGGPAIAGATTASRLAMGTSCPEAASILLLVGSGAAMIVRRKDA